MKDNRILDMEDYESKELSIITYALRHMSFDNISIDKDYYESLCDKVDRNYCIACDKEEIMKGE